MQEGFGKALSFCIGKEVCWNDEIGKKFVEDTLMRRRHHEESVGRRSLELQQIKKDTSELIEEIISVAVHRCESLIIEELPVEKTDTKRKGKHPSHLDSVASSEGSQVRSRGSQSRRKSSKGTYNISEFEGFSSERKSTESQIKSIKTLTPKKVSICAPEENPIKVSVDHEINMYSLTYFISFDVIKDVLSSVFWSVSVRNIEDKSVFEIAEDLFNESKREDFNSRVLVHEYLNNTKFLELMKNTTKFTFKNPIEIVKNLVNLQKQ